MSRDSVTHEEWLKARAELLAAEKDFTHRREALTQRRMAMPWERVEKSYELEGATGALGLSDLFDGRSQLIVHHFMFAPEWDEECKSCSFMADGYDEIRVHLNHRDVTLAAVSRAPFSKIKAYQSRMGWNFPWVSSLGSDFNFDYHVSFTPEEVAAGTAYYNYRSSTINTPDEVGISVFARKGADVFHAYSCYGRGTEMMNPAYHYLDLVPQGRDEESLKFSMEWLRRHDDY